MHDVLILIRMCFQLAQIGCYISLDLNMMNKYLKLTKSSIKNLGLKQY